VIDEDAASALVGPCGACCTGLGREPGGRLGYEARRVALQAPSQPLSHPQGSLRPLDSRHVTASFADPPSASRKVGAPSGPRPGSPARRPRASSIRDAHPATL
jgi:hypothetical protein